jgi:hypothetical protein
MWPCLHGNGVGLLFVQYYQYIHCTQCAGTVRAKATVWQFDRVRPSPGMSFFVPESSSIIAAVVIQKTPTSAYWATSYFLSEKSLCAYSSVTS